MQNMFSVIHRYNAIKAASPAERKNMVPRVGVFGGKAASAYYMAKKMIRLVTAVGEVVNNDPDVGDLLKVGPCFELQNSDSSWGQLRPTACPNR